MPSICFVAGDPSGDAHAARLVDTLKAQRPELAFTGLGGPSMERAGVTLLDDLTKAAAIGPFDAARHLGRFFRAKQLLQRQFATTRPDLLILVDFGDFNLPVIAPLAKRYHIPVLYYISPQLWAWGRWRLRFVRRYVDRMVVFFPFEETFYRGAGVPVTWVGHPLVESATPSLTKEEALRRFGLNPWRRTVGLLPGSREQEIRRHLPLMVASARRIAWRMPGVQFLLPKAPTIPRDRIMRDVLNAKMDVHVAEGSLRDALQLMEAAIVVSGTATLEAALCGVPMVVIYRASWPTYAAARLAVRLPHIAMVNVLAGRELVPELLQHRATAERIASTTAELLRDDQRCEALRGQLRSVMQQLGPPGAVERASHVVFEMLDG